MTSDKLSGCYCPAGPRPCSSQAVRRNAKMVYAPTMDQLDNTRRTASKLREPEIKGALIDALIADGRIYGDTVIVSEMPVVSMSRRADLVVANGHLIGFEIKSDGDKTSRLHGQLAAYSQAFEGIVLVTGAKHLQECLEGTPSSVGVVAVDEVVAGIPKARMIRKPLLRMLTTEQAIGQMRADDLYRLSRALDFNPQRVQDRFRLEQLVKALPPKLIRDAALRAIKDRYKEKSDEFLALRDKTSSSLKALVSLRRTDQAKKFPRSDTQLEEISDCEHSELSLLKLKVSPRKYAYMKSSNK